MKVRFQFFKISIFVITVWAGCYMVLAQNTRFNWRNVNLQGMGYVTGMVIHPTTPHDAYIRTDVGGVYRLDRTNNRWQPLMDHYGYGEREIHDVESIALDPNNVNRVYAAAPLGREIVNGNVNYFGEVLVSNDRGASWTPTGLAKFKIYMGGNDDFRGMTGERLFIDPRKSDVMYFASRKDGLWRKEGNSDWAKIMTGLPVSTSSPGLTFVLCDSTAGVIASGATKNVYVGVYGSGVWQSVDGGNNWTNIGGDVIPTRAALAHDGTLFVTFGGDEGGLTAGVVATMKGSVRRFKNNVWTNVTPQNQNISFAGICVDPSNPNIVIAAKNGDKTMYRSTDQGNTWSRINVASVINEPAYYPKPNPTNFNTPSGNWGNAALVIDPAQPKRVWQTNGYGVIATEDSTAMTTTWSWIMDNLEELVVRTVVVPPLITVPGTNEAGADLFSGVADMMGFRHANRYEVPANKVGEFPWVAGVTSIDYCATQPQYVVYVGWDQADYLKVKTGFSSDNGKTWNALPNTSPGTAGRIAMSATNPQNMVWVPTQNAKPQFTKDGGQTWNVCKQTNGSDLPVSWHVSNEWWHAHVIVADHVNGNKFYYYQGDAMYASNDGGATWQRGWQRPTDWAAQGFPYFWTLQANLVPHPYNEGELWLSYAQNDNSPGNYKLFRSTDGGNTFAAVSSVAACNFVTFGKGNSAPFIYIHGRVGNAIKDGIYKSEDNGVSWQLVSDPATNQFGKISCLEADLRVQNRVYVGTGGRGIFVGELTRADTRAERTPATRRDTTTRGRN